MKYAGIHKVGNGWVMQTEGEVKHSIPWESLIQAFNSLSLDGWEFVSEVSHDLSDNGKAYILAKKTK